MTYTEREISQEEKSEAARLERAAAIDKKQRATHISNNVHPDIREYVDARIAAALEAHIDKEHS